MSEGEGNKSVFEWANSVEQKAEAIVNHTREQVGNHLNKAETQLRSNYEYAVETKKGEIERALEELQKEVESRKAVEAEKTRGLIEKIERTYSDNLDALLKKYVGKLGL
ncbi:MAG: hypothetical protein ACTSU5_18795 [Promethearchaeota archaeon]